MCFFIKSIHKFNEKKIKNIRVPVLNFESILKIDYKQINPHCSKEECDTYIENNLIFGCGKPFRVIMDGSEYKTEICDYI